MSLRRALTGFGLISGVVLGTALLHACGGDAGDEAAPGDQATTGREVAREDFVLCPAIEGIAGELAAIGGFEIDPDRGVEEMAGECFVRGEGGSFASVALVPAFVQSVAMQASGYEAPTAAAPQLSENALVIQDTMQPHAIFELLGQIIDVGMEGSGPEAPNAAAMLRAGTLVRDALVAANGG